MKIIRTLPVLLLSLIATVPAFCQGMQVTGHIELYIDHNPDPEKNNSDVAVWLEPLDAPTSLELLRQKGVHFTMVQQGHAFVPHVLLVPVGADVEFPNHDGIFHNAFSLFNGKRFDLGLYESGSSKRVKFDRPGIAYVFCNIHYEMSSTILALATPYYGLTNRSGMVKISGVPPGKYRLRVWAEGASADTLQHLSRELQIRQDSSIGDMPVEIAPGIKMPHRNKYGLPYDRQPNDTQYGH